MVAQLHFLPAKGTNRCTVCITDCLGQFWAMWNREKPLSCSGNGTLIVQSVARLYYNNSTMR
jgi:hypothetical protein